VVRKPHIIRRRGSTCAPESGAAIRRNLESSTDFNHPDIGQSPKAFYEDGDSDALNGVEIHRRTLRDRVVGRFEHDFAG